jgi:hypothetical protein
MQHTKERKNLRSLMLLIIAIILIIFSDSDGHVQTARDERTTKQIPQYPTCPKRQRKATYKVIRVRNVRSEL